MKDLIMEHILFLEVDLVVGLDSRGFLFGPIICMELGKPFLPVRKKGKLPGKVTQQKYTLEYGEVCSKQYWLCINYLPYINKLLLFVQATFELQTEFINEGTRVLIVDDLLATGGKIQLHYNEYIVLECINESNINKYLLFKGSMAAAVQLVKSAGADVIECVVIMELTLLKGRDKVGVPVHSFIQYDH